MEKTTQTLTCRVAFKDKCLGKPGECSDLCCYVKHEERHRLALFDAFTPPYTEEEAEDLREAGIRFGQVHQDEPYTELFNLRNDKGPI